MPALNAATPRWVSDLRRMIRQSQGAGWSIREQAGRVKLSRRWSDGGSSAAMLELPWGPQSAAAVLAQVEQIAGRLAQGLSLAEAAALQATAVELTPAGGISTTGEALDWARVVERFEHHKTAASGATKAVTFRRMYGPVMAGVLEQLAIRPLPRDSRTLLGRLRDAYGGEPGSSSRQQRIQYTAQLLRFAVAECGAAQRWLPPDDLSPFVGRRQVRRADATPLTDPQLVRLLEGIPDPRWRRAVALMATFGLRPVELRTIRPTADRQRLAVGYSKRTSRGSTAPREVVGLDPVGLPGLAAQLLAELAAGEPLPPLGSTDTTTASACLIYLNRRAVWRELVAESAADGERLTTYSCRHGYSLRAHQVAELSPRVTAALMGHTMQTHLRHYGQWCDADTITAAAIKATQRIAAAQAEASPGS